jgi:hypothetical protein
MSGTDAMQANAATYLPKFTKEDSRHYSIRVANSTLFGAYADTVKSITSKPFSKPVQVLGELPEQLEGIEDDTDGQGKSLQQLAKDIFSDFVTYGLGHVLVDYPQTITPEGQTPNLKQERENGFQPRLIHVSPQNLIGWRVENDTTGRPVLTQVRIKEKQTEPDGDWGDKQVDYVRVINRNDWQLYKKNDDGEYILALQGVNSLGKVPLITGYANQTGFMMADPPLKELAETNLTHYRSESDQRNILHMVRAATLFIKGFNQEEADKIALGPNQLIATGSPDADVRFVEHTGAGINSGAKDIDKLEQRMMMLGLQPFVQRTGSQTATGQGIDESRANCDIQAWVMSLEYTLYNAYQLAAEWIKAELPDNFNVKVDNDFAIWMRAAQDVAQLIQMRQAKELSQRTFLQEIKRRGIISDTIDIDNEIQAIEAEGPALGMLGLGENTGTQNGQEKS